MYCVERYTYDYFTGSDCDQKLFTNASEALAYFRETRSYDVDYGDHINSTRIFVCRCPHEIIEPSVIESAIRRHIRKYNTPHPKPYSRKRHYSDNDIREMLARPIDLSLLDDAFDDGSDLFDFNIF